MEVFDTFCFENMYIKEDELVLRAFHDVTTLVEGYGQFLDEMEEDEEESHTEKRFCAIQGTGFEFENCDKGNMTLICHKMAFTVCFDFKRDLDAMRLLIQLIIKRKQYAIFWQSDVMHFFMRQGVDSLHVINYLKTAYFKMAPSLWHSEVEIVNFLLLASERPIKGNIFVYWNILMPYPLKGMKDMILNLHEKDKRVTQRVLNRPYNNNNNNRALKMTEPNVLVYLRNRPWISVMEMADYPKYLLSDDYEGRIQRDPFLSPKIDQLTMAMQIGDKMDHGKLLLVDYGMSTNNQSVAWRVVYMLAMLHISGKEGYGKVASDFFQKHGSWLKFSKLKKTGGSHELLKLLNSPELKDHLLKYVEECHVGGSNAGFDISNAFSILNIDTEFVLVHPDPKYQIDIIRTGYMNTTRKITLFSHINQNIVGLILTDK